MYQSSGRFIIRLPLRAIDSVKRQDKFSYGDGVLYVLLKNKI